MEDAMKILLLALLLLSLTVAGCVVEPGRGFDARGWEHHDSHQDREQHNENGGWDR
jgi:hypothetical protein